MTWTLDWSRIPDPPYSFADSRRHQPILQRYELLPALEPGREAADAEANGLTGLAEWRNTDG